MSSIVELLNESPKKVFNNFYKAQIKQIRIANKFTTMVQKANLKEQLSELQSQYKEYKKIATSKKDFNIFYKTQVKQIRDANKFTTMVKKANLKEQISEQRSQYKEQQQITRTIAKEQKQIARTIVKEQKRIAKDMKQNVHTMTDVSVIARLLAPIVEEQYLIEQVQQPMEDVQQLSLQRDNHCDQQIEVVMVQCVYEVFQLESQELHDEFVEQLPQDPDQIELIMQCDLCDDGNAFYTCQQCVKCICEPCFQGVITNSRCCPFCKHQSEQLGNVRDFVRETHQRLFQLYMAQQQGSLQLQMQQLTQYQNAIVNMMAMQGSPAVQDPLTLPTSYEPNRQFDVNNHVRAIRGGIMHINIIMAEHAIALLPIYPVELSSIEAQQQYLTLPDYVRNDFQQQEPRELPYHLRYYFDGLHITDGRLIQNYYTAYNSFSQSIYNALEAQIPVQQVVPDILQNEQMESEEIDELQSIMDVVNNSEDDIIINASAGCGKTYTLRKISEKIKQIYNGPKVAYIVFNQKNKQEASEFEEFKDVDIFTFNGFGKHQFETPEQPAKKYDLKKLDKILAKIPEYNSLNKSEKIFVEKMIGLCKANSYGRADIAVTHIINVQQIRKLLLEHLDDPKTTVKIDSYILLQITARALLESQKQRTIIDFSDDIWLVVMRGMVLKQYDIILFDESQDFNQVQIDLINMYKQQHTTRFIIVGDEFQSIYGFRGSTGESIKILKNGLIRNHRQNRLQMRTLSTNYRCDKNIIEYVNNKCEKNMKHAVNINVDSNENVQKLDGNQMDEMILARIQEQGFTNNTVLVSNFNITIMQWIQRMSMLNVPINYDIESMIKKVYKKYDRERQLSTLKLMYPLDVMSPVASIASILQELIDAAGKITIAEFIQQFNQVGGMQFMTIHKSKGLEYKNVIYIPIDPAKDTGSQESKNLEYIALTRAKHYIYIFEDLTDLQADFREYLGEPGIREQIQEANHAE